ncbi:MAG: hypothetical protein AAGB35_10250 [Pseudomonadota bacterium]
MKEFEKMTTTDVINAQQAWVEAIITQDIDSLLKLYDFGTKEAPLLFKPTLTDVIRLDKAGTKSYFAGGDSDYPYDVGFLNYGWRKVEFQSAAGPILMAGGLEYKDMGRYTFVNKNGDATRADYTFAYHKLNGKVLISLHHSSLTWIPHSR